MCYESFIDYFVVKKITKREMFSSIETNFKWDRFSIADEITVSVNIFCQNFMVIFLSKSHGNSCAVYSWQQFVKTQLFAFKVPNRTLLLLQGGVTQQT